MHSENSARDATVVSVGRAPEYGFSKPTRPAITLLASIGIEGDAHAGETVKHQFLMQRDPAAPNLRQVHLLSEELIDELNAEGFTVTPGDLGENITTRGLDLIKFPAGTRLRLGAEVTLEVTGLRYPCSKLDDLEKGLFQAVIGQDEHGDQVLKLGVMSIVVAGGEVRAGDAIEVALPREPHVPLKPV